MATVVRHVTRVPDWGSLWLIVGTALTLVIAVDPPFGFGSLRIVASLVAGALLTLLVSRYYYRRASEELRSEAAVLRSETAELRHHMRLLMRALQNEGAVEFTWKEGKPDAHVVRISAASGGVADMSSNPTVGGEGNEDADQR